ncbi:unnamed protein product [Caenorhabditis bovis]|uniref:Uncharacterized protein n=1 Tax=Caenorhabditis bovis TaxID=2654633 RepID=A0A8S1ERA1_9PELO|nr:unnamed protein product [Caenorhabditis bovis]
MATESNERVPETPTQVGPPADPALLATGAGASATDAELAGVAMAVEAMRRYQKETQEIYERVRNAAHELKNPQQEAAAAITQKVNRLSDTLTDTRDAAVPANVLAATYVGSSVALAVFTLASLTGTYLLAPILGLLLPSFGAGLLAAAVIPAYAIYSNMERRADLLVLAGIQGILAGHAVAYSYLSSTPLAVLSPIVAAFVVPYVARQGRVRTLGGVLGASMGAHVLVGLVAGSLSMPYMTLAALYTGALAVPIQLSTVEQSNASEMMYSTTVVALTVAAKLSMFAVFGASTNQSSSASAAAGGAVQPTSSQ